MKEISQLKLNSMKTIGLTCIWYASFQNVLNMFLEFVLEYATRLDQKTRGNLKLNETLSGLMYADNVNVIGRKPKNWEGKLNLF
jgi:hypothetical protein